MVRRSTDMVSGMVRTSGIPRAAQTKASPTPVLPEVGSITVTPSRITPLSRASSIIDLPIRSLTLDMGLKDSSLKRTSAPRSLPSLGVRTRGVPPIVSTTLSKIRAMSSPPVTSRYWA